LAVIKATISISTDWFICEAFMSDAWEWSNETGIYITVNVKKDNGSQLKF
jgi:hypothetical protein